MTKDEAMKMALEALEDVQDMMTTSDWFNDRVQAVRQALAEPDKHIKELRANLNRMRHFQEWGEVGFATGERIAGYNAAVDEMLEHLREMGLDDDTGTDRGAWADVPDATKWVDELRGDEPEPFGWLFKQADGDLYKLLRGEDAKWHEKNNPSWIKVSPLYTAPPKTEFECPRCGHCCWTPDDMAYRPGGFSMEKLQPIGEIVDAHGLIGVSIPEMPPVGTKLYTAPPKREWQCLTDEEIEKEHYFPFDYRKFARAVEAKLKEKNNG